MKNKSYDYIFGNGKFNAWFNILVVQQYRFV